MSCSLSELISSFPGEFYVRLRGHKVIHRRHQLINHINLQFCQLRSPMSRVKGKNPGKASIASTLSLLSLKCNTSIPSFSSALNQPSQNHFNHCCNYLGKCDITSDIFQPRWLAVANQQEWFILEAVYVRNSDDWES